VKISRTGKTWSRGITKCLPFVVNVSLTLSYDLSLKRSKIQTGRQHVCKRAQSYLLYYIDLNL